MSLLSYCIHFYFGRRECPCNRRRPAVPKLLSIIELAFLFIRGWHRHTVGLACTSYDWVDCVYCTCISPPLFLARYLSYLSGRCMCFNVGRLKPVFLVHQSQHRLISQDKVVNSQAALWLLNREKARVRAFPYRQPVRCQFKETVRFCWNFYIIASGWLKFCTCM